jgi:hypothetical protein
MRGTQGETRSPLLALNLVCLDAPLVAIGWQQLFARTLHNQLAVAPRVALFATAWLIYLADRLGDSFTVPLGARVSERQQFAQEYRSVLLALIGIAAVADLIAISHLDRLTAVAGSIVGSASVVYLVANHFFNRLWRLLPAKEIAVGALFAGGVAASLAPVRLPLAAFVFFATLCILNCISIAFWERELDANQDRISIATRFPQLRALPPIACAALALIGLSDVAISNGGVLVVAIATSAALLLLLHLLRLSADTRTAVADLVLLTPFFALPFAS